MKLRAIAAALPLIALAGCSASPGATPTVTVTTTVSNYVTVQAVEPGPTTTVTETTTVTAQAPAAAPGAAASGTTIAGDGTYLVGTDIKPGTYRSNNNEDDCYWARLSSTSGSDDIIANSLGKGTRIVTIDEDDKAFTTERCNQWVKVG